MEFKTKIDLVLEVKKRIMEQGAYGYDDNRQGCVYLAESGNKCALGVMLPEAFFDAKEFLDLNTESVCEIPFAFLESFMPDSFHDIQGVNGTGIFVTFLTTLQGIHDTCAKEHLPLGIYEQIMDWFCDIGAPYRLNFTEISNTADHIIRCGGTFSKHIGSGGTS